MTLIIDANVIGKLFLQEDDRQIAHDFIAAVVANQHKLFAPSLLILEVFGIAIHHGLDFVIPQKILASLEASILTVIEPNRTLWERAYTIAQTGNKKAGYPSLQDSIYHALAIQTGGTFITADKRHLAKTKDLGHAVHLHEWQSVLTLEN